MIPGILFPFFSRPSFSIPFSLRISFSFLTTFSVGCWHLCKYSSPGGQALRRTGTVLCTLLCYHELETIYSIRPWSCLSSCLAFMALIQPTVQPHKISKSYTSGIQVRLYSKYTTCRSDIRRVPKQRTGSATTIDSSVLC